MFSYEGTLFFIGFRHAECHTELVEVHIETSHIMGFMILFRNVEACFKIRFTKRCNRALSRKPYIIQHKNHYNIQRFLVNEFL